MNSYAGKFGHLSKFLKETSIERYYRRVIAAEQRTLSVERDVSKKQEEQFETSRSKKRKHKKGCPAAGLSPKKASLALERLRGESPEKAYAIA